VGFAILFTPRNPTHVAPWSVLQDVTFRKNIVRHTASGIDILASDDTCPSQQTRRIAVTNNLLWDVR
jgi:hypothetical protein